MSQRSTRAQTTFTETVAVSFGNFRPPRKLSEGLRANENGRVGAHLHPG
jgi:hypothetical protein